VYPYEISQFSFVEHIDAVDIDPKVKEVAEQYLLQEKLSPKVQFIPESARYAVRRLAQEGKQYDLIIVDAFLGRSVPAELVTQEFMQDLLLLSSNKQILWNMILDNDFHSRFSQRFLKTAETVFGTVLTYDVMADQNRPI
jgi:spermidine synthase